MTEENFTYEVRCSRCRSRFKVHLFESHEKNLFLVDKKEWYCEKCKNEYFKKQAEELTKAHQSIGFTGLEGTQKQVSWAAKIRDDMINKVNYLQSSLTFESEAEKAKMEKAFEMFKDEWRQETAAKWWIDHRKMTVRDISKRVTELSQEIQSASSDKK